MTNPDDPAFLTIEQYPGGTKTISSGLTKREYFAVQFGKELFGALYMQPELMKHWEHKGIAIQALSMAEALIEVLNNK